MSTLSLEEFVTEGRPASVAMDDSGPLTNEGEKRARLTEIEAQANVRAVLELCAAGQLRCSEKTSRPGSASVETVASQLADGDFYSFEPIASFAWPLLLQAGGLAKINAGRLELTAKGRAALSRPAAEVIRGLWRRWLTNGVIDEFSRIDEIKGQRSRNVLSAVRPRRESVAKALASCPSDEWLGVDALFASMQRAGLNPSVHRSEMALWKLYLGDAQYGSLGYDVYHRWEMLEGRYTLAVLFEYAATLGLIDVEYVHPSGARDDFRDNCGGDWIDALSRYDGLRAIRLTALGSYALGLSSIYQPPAIGEGAELKLLSNLDIVATGTPTKADELLLSAFAERTADRVWAVSAKSLLGALDAGRDPAEFATFLTGRADTGLPGTLQTLLDDVVHRAGRLTDLGHARVIECADPAVAALIANDRTLRGLCRPLGERHLAVPLEAELKFRTGLRRLGYVMPGSLG
ncbi:MAG TPA: helicase-associated domain-containing protein [Nakamurella sp.]